MGVVGGREVVRRRVVGVTWVADSLAIRSSMSRSSSRERQSSSMGWKEFVREVLVGHSLGTP